MGRDKNSLSKTILIFGAGKIGRSFIGPLFGQAGYELVFVDVDRELVDLINLHQQYKVVIKSDEGDEDVIVKGVRGIHLDDSNSIVEELSGVSIVAVSVGQQGLRRLMPLLARGLVRRITRHGMQPLDIIIAENMRRAGGFFTAHLATMLPADFPLSDMCGLIETSIGKMVPFMTAQDLTKDPLQVFAEPYNTLIVDRKGFKNPIPEVTGLAPKENIKAWVDRKLFVHNLGHAAGAYIGYRNNPAHTFMYQALNDRGVFLATRSAMVESANILLAMYPNDFSGNDLTGHINDLLDRFMNRALGDTIYRVGCDLCRKLGPDDRFAAPLKAALALGLPYDHILKAMEAALSFRATDHAGQQLESDKAFLAAAENGLANVLQHISGFTPDEVRQIISVCP